MHLKRAARFLIVTLIFVSGCSSLPGLRVLSGEDTGGDGIDRSVQALDLVMADKSGGTDPSLIAAADRIEAADNQVDVIEIRPDPTSKQFKVAMLLNIPALPNTREGSVMLLDIYRRAFELTWQAALPLALGTDVIHIDLLSPQQVTTLDSGPSVIARVVATADIDRADAAVYLSGTRSLDTFFGLIVGGKMSYADLNTLSLYSGQPNHPMFMIQQPTTQPS